MDSMKNRINEILRRIGEVCIDELPQKTATRIIAVEKALDKNMAECLRYIDEIKKRRPNIKWISESTEVDISRKTIYNDNVLKLYLDERLSLDDFDFFNEKKVEVLKGKLDDLSYRYEKQLAIHVESEMLKYRIEELEKTLDSKNKRIEDLHRLLMSGDKDKILEYRLKGNSRKSV